MLLYYLYYLAGVFDLFCSSLRRKRTHFHLFFIRSIFLPAEKRKRRRPLLGPSHPAGRTPAYHTVCRMRRTCQCLRRNMFYEDVRAAKIKCAALGCCAHKKAPFLFIRNGALRLFSNGNCQAVLRRRKSAFSALLNTVNTISVSMGSMIRDLTARRPIIASNGWPYRVDSIQVLNRQ